MEHYAITLTYRIQPTRASEAYILLANALRKYKKYIRFTFYYEKDTKGKRHWHGVIHVMRLNVYRMYSFIGNWERWKGFTTVKPIETKRNKHALVGWHCYCTKDQGLGTYSPPRIRMNNENTHRFRYKIIKYNNNMDICTPSGGDGGEKSTPRAMKASQRLRVRFN